ncbi:hypothetical protein P344_00855 [Spiroplasma mirum ATCC 29335]|uniref:Uncharacterized protein n=1 Tax=Spiroplasma mirum ATCC 29335 TaxID=838561 RepID=W6AV32_9MOLU|nr:MULTISPECIES: anaerobic ribonucleoside-triphosphate reductase [Spiroplasma]AHI57544.1 hypothetical protein P344_00855 [Spiroplasma mirum ATCC 29335]
MINQGSLTIGFIGGHNAMKMIFGEGHSELEAAYDLLYQAVLTMNEIANQYKQKYKFKLFSYCHSGRRITWAFY